MDWATIKLIIARHKGSDECQQQLESYIAKLGLLEDSTTLAIIDTWCRLHTPIAMPDEMFQDFPQRKHLGYIISFLKEIDTEDKTLALHSLDYLALCMVKWGIETMHDLWETYLDIDSIFNSFSPERQELIIKLIGWEACNYGTTNHTANLVRKYEKQCWFEHLLNDLIQFNNVTVHKQTSRWYIRSIGVYTDFLELISSSVTENEVQKFLELKAPMSFSPTEDFIVEEFGYSRVLLLREYLRIFRRVFFETNLKIPEEIVGASRELYSAITDETMTREELEVALCTLKAVVRKPHLRTGYFM